tara:strand:+ start:1367 stop:1780 length:414 start_codon:yes stop_codon:yes gene_type:complete
MICTIGDVFYEALDSYSGTELKTNKEHSKFFMGVKIKKDSCGFTIYNTKKGGLFYKEIEGEQLDIFLSKGWISGVYNVAKDNTTETLDAVAAAIKREVGSSRNEKRYEFLKEKRIELMNKISNIIKLIEDEDNKHKG